MEEEAVSADPARLIGVVLVAIVGIAVYLVWGESDGRVVFAGSVVAMGLLFIARSRATRREADERDVEPPTEQELDETVESELVSA